MARTVRHARLETPTARLRLKPGRQAHWQSLIEGQASLGYQRRADKKVGRWLLRRYDGQAYSVEPLGYADDGRETPADGVSILTYEMARDAAIEALDAGPKEAAIYTVADAIEAYIEFLKAERKTAKDASNRAQNLILPNLGKVRLVDLTTDQLEKWRNKLAEQAPLAKRSKFKPRSFRKKRTDEDAERARRATINRTLTVLKAALNRAWRNGIVDDDLAWRRVKPFTGVAARRPGHLSVAEAKRLLNATSKETGFRDLAHAALLTGMRYGELAALRVRDYGSGRLHITTSKSGKARDVVLSDEGDAFFKALVGGRGRDQLMLRNFGRKKLKGDKGEEWRASEQVRPMKEACIAAKITPPVGFHQLRHTWASLAVMNGMPLMVVARNLGHSTTAMVEKHYGHLREDYVAKEIREKAPTFGLVEDHT